MPKPKKRWGQHFFKNHALLEQCVDAMELGSQDVVLEIGPGQGVLTEILRKRVSQVIAIEIDPHLIDKLHKRFQGITNLTFIYADFMEYPLSEITRLASREHLKVVANIPYYITTPLIMKLLNEDVFKQQGITPQTPIFEDIYVMIQKEVAERIIAEPGTKQYGLLSMAINYAAIPELLAVIDRKAFYPAPKVDSALLRLSPIEESFISIQSYQTFWNLARSIFQFRRKTLRNVLKYMNLKNHTIDELSQEFDLHIRGETFDLFQVAAIANRITQKEGKFP